jgi:F-type H+-transporting ATPase subunit b
MLSRQLAKRERLQMNLFEQLHINSTVFIQFAIIISTLMILARFVFPSFHQAAEERKVRTKGGEDLAVEILQRAKNLESEYETKLRDLNTELKAIVDQGRAEAAKQMESVVAQARQEAQKQIEVNRKQIMEEVKAAKVSLAGETLNLAGLITQKIVGK